MLPDYFTKIDILDYTDYFKNYYSALTSKFPQNSTLIPFQTKSPSHGEVINRQNKRTNINLMCQ